MSVPDQVADSERIHRRIHPAFIKPDGMFSSQAFRDAEMSVDRATYRTITETLSGHQDHGLVGLLSAEARGLGQNVISAKELLNLAHALVTGNKSKSIARKLAGISAWVVQAPGF